MQRERKSRGRSLIPMVEGGSLFSRHIPFSVLYILFGRDELLASEREPGLKIVEEVEEGCCSERGMFAECVGCLEDEMVNADALLSDGIES